MIKTGSWYENVPEGHVKVGISRFAPRGMPRGYKLFRALAPGAWFNSVAPIEYLRLYDEEILSKLDPEKTKQNLLMIGDGRVPVLCCFERVADISAGRKWCHRHIVAQWLEDTLGIEVPEVGAEDGFDRWIKIKNEGLDPPSYSA